MAFWPSVVVATPAHSGVGATLTYRSELSLAPGTLVRVPLGAREVLGVVWECPTEPPEGLSEAQTRAVASVLEGLPSLNARWRQLVRFAAQYYQRSLGEVALAALPPQLRDLRPEQLARRLRRPAKAGGDTSDAIENIKKINPKLIVLISTVDVYPNPISVDENTEIDIEEVQPYGKNRLYLENWVASNFDDYLIVRLPGLFGKNIKKNFIFDLISVIPSMLNEAKYQELVSNSWIVNNYTLQENGFYKLNNIENSERKILKQQFLDVGFSALNFTDSRGSFQFYNLKHLWDDIQIAQNNSVKKLNLATEPIIVNEIYKAVYGKDFVNELNNPVPNYDFYTVHGQLFKNHGNYISTKQEVLQDIVNFIKSQQ